mgnify:FL=1
MQNQLLHQLQRNNRNDRRKIDAAHRRDKPAEQIEPRAAHAIEDGGDILQQSALLHGNPRHKAVDHDERGVKVKQRIDQLDNGVDVDENLLVLSLLKVAVGTELLEVGILDLAAGGQHHKHAVAHLFDRGTQAAGKAIREV